MSKNYKFKQIYIEITKNCNLNCPFCPSVSNREPNLTDNSFREIIEKIKGFTDTIYLHILGEPLTNVLISKYILIAKEHGIKVRITTNGMLLFDKKEELLGHDNLERINISLQSWHYLNNIQVEKNISNLVSFIKYKKESRPKLPLSLRFWNDKTNEFIIKKNEYLLKKLSDELNLDLNINHPEDYLLVSFEDEFIWPSVEHNDNNKFSLCLGGKNQLGILLNGDVVLCCLDYLGKTKLGNIYENSLSDILNGNIFQKHLMSLNNKEYHFELCRKCTFRNRFISKK